MARLLVHVEGQTEEDFVNEVLAPHLLTFGYVSVSARLMGNSRMRNRKHGICAWSAAKKDIINHFKQDAACLQTTIVDYYALPRSGNRAWPGREDACQLKGIEQQANRVESAMLADVCQELGDRFDLRRFLPFVVMHEFESWLFSDCKRFSAAIYRPELFSQLQAIRDQFVTPEEINDDPEKAPSKRVGKLIQGYEKPLFGTLAVLEIGLDTIRRECSHFRTWLERLEVRHC